MNTMTAADTKPDYTAIKAKQNATWASGDYSKIGVTLQIVGEQLAEAMDLAPNSTVLDVAAGNGNATLAFARRWAHVTSTDYVDTLLARGRQRAEAEGLDVQYKVADAENLPFDGNSFDAVVSTFGVMFTPNQKQAANELLRVCRSGGKIGLANWTPEGFIGQVFKTLGRHVSPPPGVQSPALWGTQGFIEDSMGQNASSISFALKDFVFRYQSPNHFVQFFREFYGPVHKAFLSLAPHAQTALTNDLIETIQRFNTATDGSVRVPSQYAEIVVAKN